ncbi:MAG: alpha/beta hydrolase [Pseudomonadota bacterium]
MLARLAVRMDTWGAKKQIEGFRTGWPSKSRDDMQFFDSGKVQYRYRERAGKDASAPTIVFAADPPVTLEAYDEMLDVFSEKFRVIVFELPAMGFTTARGSFGYEFRETGDEVAIFCEAVAGPGAILAFSCVAGLSAVDIAARHPALAAKLALIQTTDWAGFQEWKKARDPKRILVKPFVGQLAMRKLAKARAPAWFDLVVGVKEAYQPLCNCADETLSHGAQWKLASAYQRYLTTGASPLRKVEQPMLIVWGKEDGSHNAEAPVRAKTMGANAELIELDGIGHFPELEDTRRTFEIISAFADR